MDACLTVELEVVVALVEGDGAVVRAVVLQPHLGVLGHLGGAAVDKLARGTGPGPVGRIHDGAGELSTILSLGMYLMYNYSCQYSMIVLGPFKICHSAISTPDFEEYVHLFDRVLFTDN